MRLDNEQLVELLAQRYVIGTMQGAARRRFAKIIEARPEVAAQVALWEERLAPLAWSLPPMQPSDLVWQRIRRELGLERRSSGEPPTPRSGMPWAAVAAAFALLSAFLGFGWYQAERRPPEVVTITERVVDEVTVAVVVDDASQALWVTRIIPGNAEIDVRVVNAPEPQPDNDYQLWLLTADGTPISLGLLPQTGTGTLSMDAAAIDALDSSELVAVSLEPEGGSPEPAPTGPVLYTAALLGP